MIAIKYIFTCDVPGCGTRQTAGITETYWAYESVPVPALPVGWTRLDNSRIACGEHRVFVEVEKIEVEKSGSTTIEDRSEITGRW